MTEQPATHVIEIFLPLYDNEGDRFGPGLFQDVRSELVEKFGGLTAFTRSPAEGLWEHDGRTSRDDIVIFEVMTEDLDEPWWRARRKSLERDFRQDEVVIRAQQIRRL